MSQYYPANFTRIVPDVYILPDSAIRIRQISKTRRGTNSPYDLFTRCPMQLYYLLLTDVNEWINGECSKCRIPHLNISKLFTHSHPSKGENSRKISNVNKTLECK